MKRQTNWMRAIGCVMLASAVVRGDGNPLGSASPFAGTFSDGKLTVELAASGDGYTGTVSLAGKQYPAKASAAGERLLGTFMARGKAYAFTATMAGDQMSLASGDMVYTLARARGADANNPLAGGGMAAVREGGQDQAAGSAEFRVLGSTQSGKTMFVKLSGAATVQEAVLETAADLTKEFDAKPELSGAFANAQTKTQGGALFTAKRKGADVKGWIFCGLDKRGGATATVIYADAASSKTQVAALFSFMPADVKLTEHPFPDGSGSVSLPEGWTTRDRSARDGVTVMGPRGQMVQIELTAWVNTPNGGMAQMDQEMYQTALSTYQMRMQMYRQNVAARQRNGNVMPMQEPTPPPKPDLGRDMPKLTFCPVCSGPEEVLKVFLPASENRGKRARTPYTTLDKIIEIVPADTDPQIAGDAAGVAYIAVTDHMGDRDIPVRALTRIETYPMGDGKDAWCAVFNTMRAPDETFDADLPVMNAIMTSFKVNTDVVNREIANAGEQIRKMGDEAERELLRKGQESRAQEVDNFNRFESQERAREQARHDSNSDFIEYVKGVRDVYDTRTGEMGSVDLSNVHGVVQGMNAEANDPGRFVEIPLREER